MKKLVIAVGFALAAMGSGLATGAFAGDEGTASGFKKTRTSVSLERKPEVSSATLRFSTGCRSAHSGSRLSDNISVNLDQDNKRLKINGSYLYQPPAVQRRIGSADCMGSRTKEIKLKDLAQGKYEVFRDGKLLWEIELGKKPLKIAAGSKSAAYLHKKKAPHLRALQNRLSKFGVKAHRVTGSIRISKTKINRSANFAKKAENEDLKPPRYCYCMPPR